MKKVIICYKFENFPLSQRNRFRRKMFGSKEQTHGGKYTAETQGFLSDKEYEKPVRSVLIINSGDVKGILKILDEFKAKHWIFHILED